MVAREYERYCLRNTDIKGVLDKLTALVETGIGKLEHELELDLEEVKEDVDVSVEVEVVKVEVEGRITSASSTSVRSVHILEVLKEEGASFVYSN